MAVMLSSFGMIIAPAQGFTGGSQDLFHKASLAQSQKPAAAYADEIVVYKAKHVMYLLRNGRILKKYRIALGKNPVGHKLQWGDNRTPEGKYRIDLKNGQSSFYRSIRISYPDATDSDVASALDINPGDWIMIHGMPNGRGPAQVGHPSRDWTNGCIAVTNAEMSEIWNLVRIGTPISIWP